ncbi:MAG: AAA family ATPase, partial [Acidimicrobiia bacterium]|nr:AAA family ATPase [Acidimicrobiia bacterium]
MVTESEALADFVPDILLARLAGASPVSGAVPLVAWFGDLSGFTALTEELATSRAGPEQVTDLLNSCFAEVIDSIRRHGGDILGFAGDSILAGWTAAEGEELGGAVRLAAHCGLEAVGTVRRFGESQGRDLSLRVGVGAGTGYLMDVGGDRNEWHFVAGGVPFVQMGEAQEIAKPGEVVVSSDAWDAAGPRLRGTSRGGSLRVSGVDVDHLPGHRAVSVPDRIVIDLRNHVAETVRLRLEVGGGSWLAELRSISAVMVNLPKLFCVDQNDRAQVERAAHIVQTVIHQYEGTLNKVLVDEKGTTFVCAFGLPPRAHVGDAVRALEASLGLNRQLVEARIEHGIGVATGRAFCGAYGGVGRRDYTMIGPVVNMAARLMKVSHNEVICDQNSAAASRPAIMLGEPRRVDLHGFAHPVDVYRALWTDHAGAAQPSSIKRRVIGRERELRQLTAWLGALAHGRTSSVVVIDGEPGIGKSALVHELVDDAAAFRVRVGTGGASELESASPYHAWRDLLDGLLGFGPELDADARAVAIAGRFESRPDLTEWLPLLNAVLGTRLAENATTRAMSGTSRRSSTIEMVVHLLQNLAADQPIVAILEDVQWADSSSWALLGAVKREVQPLLLVLTSRPEGLAEETMTDLLADTATAEMTLEPLDENHVVALAADRLGVDDIPPEIARVIARKSEGHPLYAEELAFALRDRGALSVRDGRARLLMNESALAGLDLPNTLQDIVTSRLDQLSSRQQLTVKVASVVGRNFDDEIVRTVHPVSMTIDELEAELDELETMGLVDRGTETTHEFKHVIIQEAAYELLAYEQRRNLHKAVAEYLEGHEPLNERYALLAHHWERADDPARAVSYLERAGGTAFSKGSNKEAISFHRKSLSLDAANGRFVTDRQRADWYTQLGQAHEALGDLTEADTQLRAALHYLGFEPLNGTVRRVAGVLWGLLVQIVHILIPIVVRNPKTDEEAARLARAARVFALLGELSYFTVDLIGFPLYNLRAINLGEKSGHPVAAGVAYSSLGYLVGTLRLKRLARRYFRMARAAERFEAEREVTERVGSRSLADLGPGHLIAVALSESTYLL